MEDDTILMSGLSSEEQNLISLKEESMGFESSELAALVQPKVTTQYEFWLVAIMAVLAMVTLIQFFKKRSNVKSADNMNRFELIDSENKDTSATQKA